jgi:hypothetical protein
MARNTFFSFHYERDSWRAGQVRNCDLLATEDEHGFVDAVEWESIERAGPAAIERWIDDQMKGTTVTVVLIGAETAEREWVHREIIKSWNRGNGVVGVRIHNVKDQNKETAAFGRNPFELFELPDGALMSSVCKVHDWVDDDGRNNLGSWSENAIELRKKYAASDHIKYIGDRTIKTAAQPIERSARVVNGITTPEAFRPRAPWCASYGRKR